VLGGEDLGADGGHCAVADGGDFHVRSRERDCDDLGTIPRLEIEATKHEGTKDHDDGLNHRAAAA
jgi:hypothetical protein